MDSVHIKSKTVGSILTLKNVSEQESYLLVPLVPVPGGKYGILRRSIQSDDETRLAVATGLPLVDPWVKMIGEIEDAFCLQKSEYDMYQNINMSGEQIWIGDLHISSPYIKGAKFFRVRVIKEYEFDEPLMLEPFSKGESCEIDRYSIRAIKMACSEDLIAL